MKKLMMAASLAVTFAAIAGGKALGAPRPENVPELMKTFGGEKVETLAQWEKIRAPEILERFRNEVFGVRPKEADERSRVSFTVDDVRDAMDGKAVRKMVTVKFAGPKKDFSFPVTVFIPKSEKPVPAFVFICNRPRSNIDADRSIKSDFWPAEEIVARGYATAAFQFCDVAMDDKTAGFGQDVFPAFQDVSERKSDSWAAISAWAWGASRILDWMETEPLIDAKHVGVVGHSRGGKTAIWTAATDKRFAMACSNDSGCTGAKLNHIDLPKSESIDKICRFTHWFCKNYDKYRGKDKEMDFDQHELLALIAPRLLCVASATEDHWAGQPGEWWGAKLASPAWALYGKKGLVADAWPKAETPQQEGFISYHMRTGKHDLTPYDWARYMDFADRHGWRSPSAATPWEKSEWIEAADAKVADEAIRKKNRAADGTSWFVRELVNEGEVKSAKWTTTGLGVYELYVNGKLVGDDALKPGFTHAQKTRRSFSYDVTGLLKTANGEKNFFAAEVSSGWWRDRIANYAGKKSAFRAVLEVTFADGSAKVYGTDTANWKAGVGGPVSHAGIFDGEEYDARIAPPVLGDPAFAPAEKSDEFNGEILPSEGGEICRRFDKELKPVVAYVWKGVDGANEANKVSGRIHKLRDVSFDGKTPVTLAKGETLVVDFGQNCAGVPAFTFKAKEGTVLTCLPGEMLNDANGEKARGNDGPGGSLYRANLRIANEGMRLKYTFGKGDCFASYLPRHTFFGYRYISVTATDDVSFKAVTSVPVTSIKKEMELGSLETGVADLNRLVLNVYWGQLSNYLSVPTDCPQRNERLGWTADTQVFTEAGAFNADTRAFFHKWTRDLRDSQHPKGGFTGVAPAGPYGAAAMRFGWADAGVIVPYTVWKQFGDESILAENWAAMEKYVDRVNETKYEYEATKGENGGSQWADWLSYELLEVHSKSAKDGKKFRPETIRYWNYLGACYWRWDAQMMEKMAAALGKDSAKYAKMAENAKAYLKKNFFEADGLLAEPMRGMQTPNLFALKLGLVEGKAKEATIANLRRNFAEHGDCLQTGFLGTSIIMDTLTENGMADIAYTLLLQHKNPSWLYSVDQGATTIWERWNSYTNEKGFGPVSMNSFNHYAYGAVLAWMYRTMAGIAADPNAPGFKNIIMAPKPDKRVSFVKAEYKSAAGLVKSHWHYEGNAWVWDFTIPEGATADVTLPGETASKRYAAGTYHIEK